MRRTLASAHHRLDAQHSWPLPSSCVCTILICLLPVTFTHSGSVPYFSNQHWLDQYLDILLSSAPTTRAGTSLIVTPSHLQNIWSINAYLWSFAQGPCWFEQMATWYRVLRFRVHPGPGRKCLPPFPRRHVNIGPPCQFTIFE